MRVHVVDPSAFTPPYDHALCAALARAGAEVELVTSRFAYGGVPDPDGYARRELFYRRALAGSRLARAGARPSSLEHVPDMLRYRQRGCGARTSSTSSGSTCSGSTAISCPAARSC